jgi:hypothetical protein
MLHIIVFRTLGESQTLFKCPDILYSLPNATIFFDLLHHGYVSQMAKQFIYRIWLIFKAEIVQRGWRKTWLAEIYRNYSIFS